jgi:hypothetical protein
MSVTARQPIMLRTTQAHPRPLPQGGLRAGGARDSQLSWAVELIAAVALDRGTCEQIQHRTENQRLILLCELWADFKGDKDSETDFAVTNKKGTGGGHSGHHVVWGTGSKQSLLASCRCSHAKLVFTTRHCSAASLWQQVR